MINMGYRYLKGSFVTEDEKDNTQIKFPNQWREFPGTRVPHVVLGKIGNKFHPSTYSILILCFGWT